MRIALIQALNPEMEDFKINRFNADYSLGGRNPLGIAYIASTLLNAGHEVIIIDRAAFHAKSFFKSEAVDAQTKKELFEFEPDIIGISTLTGTFSDAKHCAKMIRRLNGFMEKLIVMGGFHPTVEAEAVMNECPEVDLILRGEAEYPFLDLANGVDVRDIAGVVLRTENDVDRYLLKPIPINKWHLDELPYPARHLLDMEYYTQPTSTAVTGLHLEPATFISSRGCFNKCKFCGAKEMNRIVRSHSAEYVIGEIEHVVGRYNVSCIVFADQMFLTQKDRVKKFCQMMIDKKLHKEVSWTANARVDSVNSDILKLMKEAGCIWLCFGFETGSEKVMKSINKNTTVQQNKKAAKMTTDTGILVAASMIAGLPDEDEEDFWDSYNFIDEIQPFSSGFNFFTLFPGTEYYNEFYQSNQNRNNSKDWRELGMINVKKSRSYSSIGKERLTELIQKANQRDSNFSNKNYYKYNFIKNQQQALIRYAYTGQKTNVYDEECYKFYFKAFEYYKKKDFINAIETASKAIDNRVCLIPCPCPSGCCFHYDLNYIIAFSHLENRNYEKALNICKKYYSSNISGFSSADFINIINQCCKRLGIRQEINSFKKKLNVTLPDQKKYRKIPGLHCSIDKKRIIKDLTNIFEFPENIQPNAVLNEEIVRLDCVISSKQVLAITKPVSLEKGRYSLYYELNSSSGSIKVEILDKNEKSLIFDEHSVSTCNLLEFKLKKNGKIKVAISSNRKNLPTFINVELLKLTLLNE